MYVCKSDEVGVVVIVLFVEDGCRKEGGGGGGGGGESGESGESGVNE